MTMPGGGGTGGGMMMPGGGKLPAGSPYAFCTVSTDCMAASSCSTSSRTNGTVTGYCSPGCLLRVCPKPMSGDVTTSCVAGQCALGSCQNANCPDWMNCVQTRVLGQQVYSCEYPTK